MQRTAAGLGSVIIDSQPLTVAVLAALLFGETISVYGYLGLMLGILGLCLLELSPESFTPLLSLQMPGRLIRLRPCLLRPLQVSRIYEKTLTAKLSCEYCMRQSHLYVRSPCTCQCHLYVNLWLGLNDAYFMCLELKIGRSFSTWLPLTLDLASVVQICI